MVDDRATQAALSAMILRVRKAGPRAAIQGVLVIQRLGMQKTPVLSGTTRRSWHAESITIGALAGAITGPSTIYARRLELGFYDRTDSLGRHYMQKPKPYVRPAFIEGLPAAKRVIDMNFASALRG